MTNEERLEKLSETGKKSIAKLKSEGKIIASSERARELQKLSAQSKRNAKLRRERSMQDIARWLGQLTLSKDLLYSPDEIQDMEKAKAINLTANEAILLAQYQKAITGDTKAAEFIRDTAGEKPKEQIEVQGMTIDEYAQNHKPKF